MSRLRQAGNRALVQLTRILYRVSRSDLCYGFAAFRRSSIMALSLTATGCEIEVQLFLRAERARLAITEVPSFEAPSYGGTSNQRTFRDGWRVLRTIIAERLRSQQRLGAGVAVPMGEDADDGRFAVNIEPASGLVETDHHPAESADVASA